MTYFGGAYDTPNNLTHYGVKGMKWGVRRAEKRAAKAAAKEADRKSESGDHKKASALKKRKISSMSNEELRSLNERMNLEQQYSKLTAKPPSVGKKIVGDAMKEIAKETMKNSVKSSFSWAGKAAMAKTEDRRTEMMDQLKALNQMRKKP